MYRRPLHRMLKRKRGFQQSSNMFLRDLRGYQNGFKGLLKRQNIGRQPFEKEQIQNFIMQELITLTRFNSAKKASIEKQFNIKITPDWSTEI